MKKKIISGLICMLLFAVVLPSVNSADLEGNIQSKLSSDWIGLVTPTMNLTENQTVSINTDSNDSVNDTLRINLEKIDNGTRDSWLFPRYMFVQVLVMQNKVLPIMKICRGMSYKAFLMNDPILIASNETSMDPYIDISLKYSIENTTTSENLTVYVFAMGLLPGSEQNNTMIARQTINLEVDYIK